MQLSSNIYSFLWCRWSIIANQLPGRTDNDVKNYWNTKLSKKLIQNGIDPVTHRPISEIIQSIGGLPATAAGASSGRGKYPSLQSTRISCFNRDLKNVFLSKSTEIIDPNFHHESKPLTSNHDFPQFYDVNSMTVATCASSSEASSSSTVVTTRVSVPSPSPEIKWSDFLAEDVFLTHNEQGDVRTQSSMGVSSGQVQYAFLGPWKGKMDVESEQKSMAACGLADQKDLVGEWYDALDGEVSNVWETSCDESSSFVDAILDHDREMVFQFPEFSDDSYNIP